ncbi:MAG: GGDEF domain-containing protein [Micrococcales bacterium]|nr:GGDEF domain-containing protein [Micrococcales bacterium]
MTWALIGAGVVTVVVTAAVAASDWRSRGSTPWRLRALEQGGLALWTVLAVVVQTTGWWAGASVVILPMTLAMLGAFGTALVQAGLTAWLRSSTVAVFCAVPLVTALLGLMPGGQRLVLTVDGQNLQAGPLLMIMALWMVVAIGGGALMEIIAAGQAVGQLRTDVVTHGAITVGCLALVPVLVLVPGSVTVFAWVPVMLLAMAIAVTRWSRGEMAPLPADIPSVLDTVSDALTVIGLDGTVIDTNRAAATQLLAPSQDSRSRVRTLNPALSPALGGDGERNVVLDTGVVLRVRTTTVFENGNPVARILSARDITELDRLRSELVDLAARDSLTGLHNRRDLSVQLAAMIDQARRDGRPLSVAMVDLDNLKVLNDRYGHQVGDRGICGVARVLSESADDDLVCRVGGDEFLVAMTGADADAAELRAQLWRVGAGKIHLGVEVPRMTLSIGVAQLEPGWDVEAFISAADGALYAAKAAGRNRVRVRPARTGAAT